MSVALVNGLDVLNLTVTRSRLGRAALSVTLADPLGATKLEKDSSVTLDLGGVAGVFTGNLWRIGRVGGTTRVEALEGLALDKVITPKFYENVQAGLVAVDILRETGLGGEAQISGQLEKYTRMGGTALSALNGLCQIANGIWRTTPDGGVLVRGLGLSQTRATKPLEWGDDLLKFNPSTLEYTCLLRPELQPDMLIEVQPYGEARDITIERIQHTIENGAVRTCIWGNA